MLLLLLFSCYNCLFCCRHKVTHNVLQARVGGLSKHQLTLPTNGILKILTLLVSRKLNFPKGPLSCARTMTRVCPLTFACCYLLVVAHKYVLLRCPLLRSFLSHNFILKPFPSHMMSWVNNNFIVLIFPIGINFTVTFFKMISGT
jgi:hypothetical protein